jgi:hypothetical protein
MLAAEFAPYFRKEAEKAKAEGNAKGGKSDSNSGLTCQDIQAKHANSTVGKVAEKAEVSEYKAARALTVANHPEVAAEVINGSKKLAAAVKEVAPAKTEPPQPKQEYRVDAELALRSLIDFDPEAQRDVPDDRAIQMYWEAGKAMALLSPLRETLIKRYPAMVDHMIQWETQVERPSRRAICKALGGEK